MAMDYSLEAQTVENLPTMQETWVRSLGWEDPLEKGMATHSSSVAWTEEPGGLQSMIESQKARHNWAANTATLLCIDYSQLHFIRMRNFTFAILLGALIISE